MTLRKQYIGKRAIVLEITDSRIDGGKAFDWGRVSREYAAYRDIYPDIFYEKIAARKLCVSGQRVLDIGTGSGALPRNMYRYGASWVGSDISRSQIEEALRLSKEGNMDIKYIVSSAEDLSFPDAAFDVITACQCFWYFKHDVVIPKAARFLGDNGKLLVLYMGWLPFEDETANASEKLIQKYNPSWTGAGGVMRQNDIPACADAFFEKTCHEEFRVDIPFTRETWHGRMKACRGVGASLDEEQIKAWEKEHTALLEKTPHESFYIKHFIAITELTKK